MQQVTLNIQSIVILAITSALANILAGWILQSLKTGHEVIKKSSKKIDEFFKENIDEK